MKYIYLRALSERQEYEAASLAQLINNAQSWPQTDRERQNLLAEFVAHHALFSSLHSNPFLGFVATCEEVLGLFIVRIYQHKPTADKPKIAYVREGYVPLITTKG